MKALFLDRDGVINKRIVGGYITNSTEFELLTDIIPIMDMAHSRGYRLVLITNQQGVAKGLMTRSDLEKVHAHMNSELKSRGGVEITDIHVCTSLASANDPRRKPMPGMIVESIDELGMKPDECWFLGDSATDALAGRAAGVHTALVGDHEPSAAEIVASSLHEMLHLLDKAL